MTSQSRRLLWLFYNVSCDVCVFFFLFSSQWNETQKFNRRLTSNPQLPSDLHPLTSLDRLTSQGNDVSLLLLFILPVEAELVSPQPSTAVQYCNFYQFLSCVYLAWYYLTFIHSYWHVMTNHNITYTLFSTKQHECDFFFIYMLKYKKEYIFVIIRLHGSFAYRW